MKFFDRVRVVTTTLGQGTLSFGAATSPNMLTPLQAGAAEGDEATYVIEEGADFEIGRGVIGTGASTMTRATVLRSLIGGVPGTAKMSLGGNAKVRIVQSAGDINDLIAALAKRPRVDAAQPFTPAEQAQARSNVSAPLKGHIFGLTLSNNVADAANDIDIAAGEAASTETNPVLMVLPTGITKRIDANWAAGTGQGGRYSGAAVANGAYLVYLATKANGADPDVYIHNTGSDDAAVLAHLQAEPGGSDYAHIRRIGAILRRSNAIVPFRQVDDDFLFETAILDRDSLSAFGPGLLSVSVPTGIVVQPYFSCAQVQGTAGNINTQIGTAGKTLDAGDVVSQTLIAGSIASTPVPARAYTNKSAQIQFAVDIGAGTLSANKLSTLGWRDRRGRDA